MVTTQSSETDTSTLDGIELPTASRTSRILLVVGDPTLRIAILSRFRLMGVEVEVASNGDLALEKLRRNQIDAVFLDLMLRETDSAKVIKRIRKDREFAELPIYGYASSFSARQLRKVTKVGATKIFDESNSSIDAIVAEVGSSLFEGGCSSGDGMEKPGAGLTIAAELQEGVDRVKRHLPQLDGRRHESLAEGYGDLRGKVQRVTNLAMRLGRYDMARLASALHAVLKVFHEIPEHATESSLHTVTVAVDVLSAISPSSVLVEGPQALQFSAAIVDDEMVSRSIVCSALRSVGFTFELFTHPAELLRYTASHRTDLVVVNMCAEETAGFDVCQRLRDQPGSGRIPVLFVSGISDFSDRKKVISSGADEVITKPFIFMELSLKAISLALRNRFAASDENPDVELAEPAPSDEDAAEYDGMEVNRLATEPEPRASDSGNDDTDTFEARLLNDMMNSLIAPAGAVATAAPEDELRLDLAHKEVEREAIDASIEETDTELEQIRGALAEEREQRTQLEIMVQQLMEGQGHVEPDPQADNGLNGNGGGQQDQLMPEEIQEQMNALASLAEELRTELEDKESARADLGEQLKSNDRELGEIRKALDQERSTRKNLQKELGNLEELKAEVVSHAEALLSARAEVDKTTALVEAKSKANEELQAQVQKLSEDFDKSSASRNELAAEREQKEKELNQQLLAAQAAAEEAATAQKQEQDRAESLKVEIDALRKQLAVQHDTDNQLVAEVGNQKAELENQLKAVQEKLNQSEKEQARLAGDRNQSEAKMAEHIAAMKSAAGVAEAALQSESKKNAELEARLKEISKKLEESTSSQKQQVADWDLLVAKLKKELDSAKEAAAQADGRAVAHARQVQKLEQNLAKQREELDAKLALQSEQSGNAVRERDELQGRLRESGEKLQQAEAAREKLISERKTVESELQEQLKAAQSKSTRTENEAQKQRERTAQLEKEAQRLAGQQKELESRLATGQKEISELQKQKSGLTEELKKAQSEVQRSQAAQEQTAADRKRVEAELGQEVSKARDAAKNSEIAAKRESQHSADLQKELQKSRDAFTALETNLKSALDAHAAAEQKCHDFESREAGLKKNCDELNQQLAAGNKRLAELADKKTGLENLLSSTRDMLKQTQATCETLTAEKEQAGALFKRELDASREAVAKSEAVAGKETERANKFEAEVTGLWKVRDDLQGKLATEQKYLAALNSKKEGLETSLGAVSAELEQTRSTLEKTSGDLSALKKEHAGLSEAKAVLDSEIALLREQQKTHQDKLVSMERRVRENVALLTRTTADLESERGERHRIEQRTAGLSNKLHEVREELNRQLEIEKESQKRVGGLEKQIADREQALEVEKAAHENERSVRRQAQQQIEALTAAVDASRTEIKQQMLEVKAHQKRVNELEHQLRVREESLVRVTEHLESERGERRRIEERTAKLEAQFQETQAELVAKKKVEKEQAARISGLGEKLNGRENALVESMAVLEAERNERAQLEKRSSEMSAQLKMLNSDLNEALETEKQFQERVAALENEIRDRKTLLEQVQADLAKETADRQLAEKQIEAAAEMSAELAHYQKAFADSRQSFDQTQSELESRIEQNRLEIEERDNKLKKESEARVKLGQEVESARKQIRELEQQSTIEVSKLRSALQSESMERRRLESDAVNSRYVTMNNNRSGQAMVNGLRRHLQTPVEQLMSSARQMLEFELQPELKKVAEGVLENALALQTSVRETDMIEVIVSDEAAEQEPVEAKQPDEAGAKK